MNIRVGATTCCAVIAVLGTACSPNFTGSYEGSLTTTYSCGGDAPPSKTSDQTYTLSDSSGTVVVDANGCSGVPAKVSGNTATIQSYTCSANSYEGASAAVTLTGGTLQLNGGALTVSVNGSTQVTGARGDTLTCDFTVAGTLNSTGS
jgi:hypothetical protein